MKISSSIKSTTPTARYALRGRVSIPLWVTPGCGPVDEFSVVDRNANLILRGYYFEHIDYIKYLNHIMRNCINF